jgi:hypothetical protein
MGTRADRVQAAAAPAAVSPAPIALRVATGVVNPAPALQTQPAVAATPSADHRQTFTRYCVTCHSQAMKERGTVPVAFDTLDIGNVAASAETWEKIVLKLRAGLMPPAGAPRAAKPVHDGFITWLEGELDRSATAKPNPGRTEPFHRLNRTEYRNAVRDLLGIEVDVASLLPGDDVSYGFDNIAGVQKMSPTLMERYLSAAQKVSRQALGTLATPNIDYFRIIDDLQQDANLSGFPLGTRGGTSISYLFPMDATYEFRVRIARDLNESVAVYRDAQPVEVSIDGERVGTFTLAGVAPPPPGAPPVPAEPDPDNPDAEPADAQPQNVSEAAPPQGAAGRGRGRGQGAAPAEGTGRGRGAGPAGGQQQPARPGISQIATGPRLSGRDRAARNKADEQWNLRVPVKAGQREVLVTFTNPISALEETVRLPFLRPYPSGVNIPETRLGLHLRSVEIEGPIDATGPGNSEGRQRVFVCHPASAADEAPCARRILGTLARRAYRRPVAAADVDPLMTFYEEGKQQGGFDAGIDRALRRLLVSPEFLLRVERDPADAKAGTPYRVSDLELASRLSFFLWSSIPDDELLELAAKRQLGTPTVLAAQVKRMLADPKSEAFVKNFASQWLFLRNLPATAPVQSVFPDFDDTLRTAFQEETELFFESIVRENRSALDLLRADYTFLNERLARHYGIPNIRGSYFRRVTLEKSTMRAGLLGQGSILSVTSYPDRTSPVVRGKWILENLLGTPPPPPIPNVGVLRPTNESGAVLSMRERMVQHRASPVCASCHSMMDPLGLALENFDAVGKWRTLGEGSGAIDASGVMPDGTKFSGPDGLRQALLTNPRFVATLTEKLMTYALGRGVQYYDAPAVRQILRDAARDDYKMTALIQGIVQSAPFRMRMAS